MSNVLKSLWDIIEKILHFILEKIFRIQLSDEKWESFMQFVKFGIVGVSNTLISYVTYLIFVLMGVQYLIAQGIGFFISVTNSFYWNNKYVFIEEEGKKRSILKTYIKTVISYSTTGLFLATFLLILWVDVLHISEYIGPIINLLITIPLNFIINKLWAFKSK